MVRFISLLISLVIFSSHALALNEVELVKNFNVYPNGIGGGGDSIVLDGIIIFEGSDPVSGEELWAIDSENATPRLIKDINPGEEGSNVNNFIIFKDKLFFTARTENEGTELWSTDGTEAGTMMVKDLDPGDESSSPRRLTIFGASDERMAFYANIEGIGDELCVTDGTSGGTFCFDNIRPGDDSSRPRNLASLNGDLFFSASNGTGVGQNGTELWVLRTNAPLPTLFADIRVGSSSSSPNSITPFIGPGNTPSLIFSAQDPLGREPWITDGTLGNTMRILDIENGAPGSDPRGFFPAPFGGVVFIADSNNQGDELWKTDGTALGTQLVKDINPGSDSSDIEEFTTVGNLIYFSAFEDERGDELWKTDGTGGGTVLVKDIWPGEKGSRPRNLIAQNDKLFFIATDKELSQEPFTSDGTTEGTDVFLDIFPGSGSSNPDNLFVYGDRIGLFADGVDEPGVYFLDPNFPESFSKINASQTADESSSIELITELDNGNILITIRTRDAGREPHILDPITREIALLKDVSPGSNSSNFYLIGKVNGKIIFRAEGDEDTGDELWATDGTTDGTILLKDIVPGSESSFPNNIGMLEPFGDYLYFSASLGEPTFRTPLFRTDGTPEGTMEFASGLMLDGPSKAIIALDNQLFFQASAPNTNDVREIWKSDGTEAGTVRITDEAITGNSSYTPLYEHDGLLFFGATNDVKGRELYKSNGTVGNITLAAEIDLPNQELSPFYFYSIGDRLLFSARSDLGPSYYYIDPPYTTTELGLLVDPAPGTTVGSAGTFFEVFDQVFFRTNTRIGGQSENTEPWVTDGTPAGTELFKIIQPGDGATEMSTWYRAGDYYYFAATEGDATGNELWRSDGTPDGTTIFEDLVPGPAEANPELFGVFRGALYFSYQDPEIGNELWRIVFDECPDDSSKIEFGECGCGLADIDSDGDGVLDCSDQCPKDGMKSTTGFCGCGNLETDSDGDGTPDCVDSCESDSLKATAGDCGCGIPDQDLDASGVSDCLIGAEIAVRADLLSKLLEEFKRKPKKGRKARLKAIFQAYKELNRYSRQQLDLFIASSKKKTKKRLTNLRKKVKKFRKSSKNKDKRKAVRALKRFLAIAP